MRIGDMQIDPLIDGECLAPPSVCYVGYDPKDWAPHEHYLDGFSGLVLHTLGGYLVRYDHRVVLVDAGIGPQPTFPFVGGGLRSALYSLDVSPSDVTDVVFTHLHLDHIGWAAVGSKPYFDKATYRVDKRDWDHFVSPDYEIPDWERDGSNPETDAARVRLAPVESRMEFFQGDAELFPGIAAVEASGHTPGSTVLRLTSAGEEGMLLGDLVHTQPELVEDRWDFAMHVDHEAGMDSIERIRKELYDRKLPFAAAHFPGMQWGQLGRDDGGKLSYRRIPG